MSQRRRIIKKHNGRYVLHIENQNFDIDLDKKTKLWLSSDYLIQEAIKENPIQAKKTLSDLIKWNTEKENYNECQKLSDMQKNFNLFLKF